LTSAIVVISFFKKCLEPTNKLVKDLINMESTYVNTGHPELLVASPVVSSEGLWARAGPRGLPVLGSTCVGLAANKLVKDLINMESTYVNTGHPDFLNGHRAMALVNERQAAAHFLKKEMTTAWNFSFSMG
jgi:hypothetical protein